MATVREGNGSALLIVDVQVGVMNDAWDAERVISNVARAVERARDEDVPVIWVQHSDTDLPQGSSAWQLVPALQPAAGEPLIHKRFESSFEQTLLEDELARLGATHVVLAGAATTSTMTTSQTYAPGWREKSNNGTVHLRYQPRPA
jgi:nicotinamidase-related amidase